MRTLASSDVPTPTTATGKSRAPSCSSATGLDASASTRGSCPLHWATSSGSRVAHLVSGKLLDYIEVEDGFTIVKMRPPREVQGFTLAQSKVRERYGVTVIGVKSPGEDFLYATPETRISANDLLIVSGHADLLERFAARP